MPAATVDDKRSARYAAWRQLPSLQPQDGEEHIWVDGSQGGEDGATDNFACLSGGSGASSITGEPCAKRKAFSLTRL